MKLKQKMLKSKIQTKDKIVEEKEQIQDDVGSVSKNAGTIC